MTQHSKPWWRRLRVVLCVSMIMTMLLAADSALAAVCCWAGWALLGVHIAWAIVGALQALMIFQISSAHDDVIKNIETIEETFQEQHEEDRKLYEQLLANQLAFDSNWQSALALSRMASDSDQVVLYYLLASTLGNGGNGKSAVLMDQWSGSRIADYFNTRLSGYWGVTGDTGIGGALPTMPEKSEEHGEEGEEEARALHAPQQVLSSLTGQQGVVQLDMKQSLHHIRADVVPAFNARPIEQMSARIARIAYQDRTAREQRLNDVRQTLTAQLLKVMTMHETVQARASQVNGAAAEQPLTASSVREYLSDVEIQMLQQAIAEVERGMSVLDEYTDVGANKDEIDAQLAPLKQALQEAKKI